MDERIKAYDVKMTKSYNNLLEEFGAIRAGRANPHVLDRIKKAAEDLREKADRICE